MDDDGPTPDPTLEGGMPLPIRMAAEFPAQLFATPIEDIDPFYSDKKVHNTHAHIRRSKRAGRVTAYVRPQERARLAFAPSLPIAYRIGVTL